MRDSLFGLALTQGGILCVALFALAAPIALFYFRSKDWYFALWLPCLLLSLLGSIACVLGTLAGSYGLLVWLAFWPFPLALVFCAFFRPKFTKAAWRYGLAGILALLVIGFIVPRPYGRTYTFRFTDPSGAPLQSIAVSYSIFGGKSSNRFGSLKTDSAGIVHLTLYDYEWGDLKPANQSKSISFEYANDYYSKGAKGCLVVFLDNVPQVIAPNGSDIAILKLTK